MASSLRAAEDAAALRRALDDAAEKFGADCCCAMNVDDAPQQSDDDLRLDTEGDDSSCCTEESLPLARAGTPAPREPAERSAAAAATSLPHAAAHPDARPHAPRGGAAAAKPEDARADAEIAELIARARAAQAVAEQYSQEQVDRLIRGMVWAVCRPGTAEAIARLAVEETRLGNYEGKLAKIAGKTRCALLDIVHDRSVGVVEEDAARGIVKIAKPVGVVGATSPSTNPEATPVIKAINAVKGRNAIVISPHPRAEETNRVIVGHMRAALERLGAPADLVIHVPGPTRAKTLALMRQCDLAFATGGQNIARNALTSGKPSFPSGVGNAVVLVDETADVPFAAQSIRASKTFDLAASCSADNAVLAHARVYDALVLELQREGGHVLSDAADVAALQRALFKPAPRAGAAPPLNPAAVVQSAQSIARMAGIAVPEDCSFLVVPEAGVGPAHPFSGEKLSPVLALYRVGSTAEAVSLCNAIQTYQGRGHSCGVYSRSDDCVLEFASGTRTARVMVNQPQALSNSGSLNNGMPVTLSLGCGTWGGSTATANINWRQLVNMTWVSRPLPTPKRLPADAELFAGIDRDAFC